MVSKGWRVELSQLGETHPAREVRVMADNWLGALRSARRQWGETAQVPPGASCSVADDGTVTVLDAASRRRFVLSTVAPETTSSAAPEQTGAYDGSARAATPPRERALAQTVGMIPDEPPPTKAAPPPRRLDQTVAFVPEDRADPVPVSPSSTPSRVRGRALAQTADYTRPSTSPPPGEAKRPRRHSETVAFTREPSVVPKPRPLNQTVAFAPEPEASPPSSAREVALEAGAARQQRRQRFQTVAFSADVVKASQAKLDDAEVDPPGDAIVHRDESHEAAEAVNQASDAQTIETEPTRPSVLDPVMVTEAGTPSFAVQQLPLLFERDENPTQNNPLTYRERAYFIDPGRTVMEAEAALRFELEAIKQSLASSPRGQFCSLAVFDHRWRDEPRRPPLVVLEWKDWRPHPEVDYPAAALSREPGEDEPGSAAVRLEVAFDALQALSDVTSASEALELAVNVTEQVVPTLAVSAGLYDIDTDQLRFVATSGPGAEARRGTAVPGQRGLIGLALAHEGTTTVIGNVQLEPAYRPAIDSRPQIDSHNMLLRPLVANGRVLGLLQLINRDHGNREATEGFTKDDVNVMNYVADRLAESLAQLRQTQPER